MKKNKIAETRTSGTVPSNIMISGDAETLSLSDLKPETVKQVAAELVEAEKSKTRSNEKIALLAARYGRPVINPYATPIFDLKSFGKPLTPVRDMVNKLRTVYDTDWYQRFHEAVLTAVGHRVIISQTHDEMVTEDAASFAERWGRMLLDAIPKKHAFTPGDCVTDYDRYEKKFEYKRPEEIPDRVEVVHDPFPRKRYFAGDVEVFPETGPEQIIGRSGKTRTAADLKIETNQQWSPEQLQSWLKAQPGNTKQERKPFFNPDKPYIGMDFAHPNGGKIVYAMISKDEIKIRNYTPDNWPASAPPYHTAEGWEFEKSMKARQLKSMLTIEWLEKQKTEKHALVAKRLREILAA